MFVCYCLLFGYLLLGFVRLLLVWWFCLVVFDFVLGGYDLLNYGCCFECFKLIAC